MLWNSCVRFIFEQPTLCLPKWTNGLEMIIPGNVKNSDFTMSVGTFKSRLINFLLKVQKKDDPKIWSPMNSLS